MGKKLTNHERACLLSKEILEEFYKGESLNKLLQKAALLAQYTADVENKLWIDKELTGTFDKERDALIILQNGRLWGTDIYRLEHVEVLESMIEVLKIRLSAATDPDISYTPASPYQHYTPHSNQAERNSITESIRINQSIISRIKSRLYAYIQNTYYSLNFTEIVSEIFTSIRKNVELKLKKFAPDALIELSTAYNLVNSQNHANWSNVASGCRRILMQVADIVYPPTDEEYERVIVKTVKLKLNKENYRYRILKFLKGQGVEDSLSRDTSEYIFEILDSVGRLSAKGDKNIIDKSVAEKILIYTYILLFEILKKFEVNNI